MGIPASRDWGYLDPPDLYADEAECLDCGTVLEGRTCPDCGVTWDEDALRDAAEAAAEPPEWA